MLASNIKGRRLALCVAFSLLMLWLADRINGDSSGFLVLMENYC